MDSDSTSDSDSDSTSNSEKLAFEIGQWGRISNPVGSKILQNQANLPKIEDLVKRKTIIYDHKAKSSDYKFSKEFKLKTLSMNQMPLFLKQNVSKYIEWFDFEK